MSGGWRLYAGVAAMACFGVLEAAAAQVEVRVRLPAGIPVEDAAVVIEPLSGHVPLTRQKARIEQFDREFVPYLSIVQRGAAVQFPNRDRIKHHVYSFSPAKIFEIKLYAGQPAKPVVFDQSGEVVLGCNIHDWMQAHVLVVDTPWFGKTGMDGISSIGGMPAGRYRLRVWHPRQKLAAAEQVVTIGAATVRTEFTLALAPLPSRFKPLNDLENY